MLDLKLIHLSNYTFISVLWRFMMTSSIFALLALRAGNSPVTGEFPSPRPVTRSFDVFFDLRLNKRLSKQSQGCWVETPSRSWWRHYNVVMQQRATFTSASPQKSYQGNKRIHKYQLHRHYCRRKISPYVESSWHFNKAFWLHKLSHTTFLSCGPQNRHSFIHIFF